MVSYIRMIIASAFLITWIGALASMAVAEEGGVAKRKHGNDQPIEVTSDMLTVNQEDQTAIFTGNVVAIQGDVRLKAQKMIVHYVASTEQESAKKNAISRIDVHDNVVINTPAETAQGDKGVYDVEKETITLTGNVILTKGKNIIKGTRLLYDVARGKSQLLGQGNQPGGRVKGVFVPNN